MKPYIDITHKAVVNEFARLMGNEKAVEESLKRKMLHTKEDQPTSENKKKLPKKKINPYSPKKRG